MSWVYLFLAILLEVSGTTCLKLSQGFTKLLPSVLLFILYGFSFISFSLALKKIEISVAYAIWSGVGTTLIATVGILWFREPLSALKIISIWTDYNRCNWVASERGNTLIAKEQPPTMANTKRKKFLMMSE